VYFRIIASSIVFLISCVALASPELNSCPTLKSPKDLYQCALVNHPDFKSAALTMDAAEASKEKVTRWPNPELSMKSVNGDVAGENVGSTELAVSLDITELLVKRPALSQLGRSEQKALSVEAHEREFSSKLQIIKFLHRYRQILDEIELLNEALGTFQKIEGQLKSRRARGPDQEITLSLVELAQGDYELRKNHVSIEKSEIEANFKGIFGDSFELKKELLPKFKLNWPKISNAQVSKQTFELQKMEAEKDRLDAEKSIAVSESWPKLSAGPVIERSTEGPTQNSSYGFNLTVDLPIFSWNAGARSLAEKNRLRSQYAYEYALKKADLEKRLLVQRYESAVESLKRATSAASLKQKHSRIDSLFRQGLTSGSNVIEAHRQITEFTESQHEHEITALESLMYLKLLSGEEPSEVF
jgi:hypothetical protein